jgi:hypothetical protein
MCHHEFEASSKEKHCDWCGASASVIMEETALEQFIKSGRMDEMVRDMAKRRDGAP